MNQNSIKNILLIVLTLSILGITVTYAVISQKLDIKSTAEVKSSTWDIHFENLSNPIAVGSGNVVTAPTLSNTSITNLDVELQKPGDSVSYTFDIVNNGSIDAKIGEYKINTKGTGIICTDSNGSTTSDDSKNVCNNLIYAITYAEDTKVEQTNKILSSGTSFNTNQELNSKRKVKAKLTISYDGNQSLASDVTITGLDAYMIYVQK